MEPRSKYLWITDTHIKPYSLYGALNSIQDEAPHGIFHTGDITEGLFLSHTLEFLGKRIGSGCKMMFVLGNHDALLSDFETTHNKVRNLCKQYKSLVWMTEAGIVPLNEETCVVGHDGWYSATEGNPKYITYTFDWWMIKDFRKLANMEARINEFRRLAKHSAEVLSERVAEAIKNFKTVYCLTHVPPWAICHRSTNPFFEAFWSSYNSNTYLGEALEKVMDGHKNRQLIVLSGHNHMATIARINRGITCYVGAASYLHLPETQRIYI